MNKYLPHLGFIAVYLLWGVNISSMKVGGHEWDPLIFNGLRYASLIPVFWLYTYYGYRSKGLKLHMPRNDLFRIAGLGILSAVGLETILAYALQYTNSANGAVLGRGFMPIITAVLAVILKEIRLTWRMMVGIPIAFVSVIVIVMGSGLHIGADTLKGDVLLLLRSFFGALYLIGMNRLVNKYPLPLLLTLEMTFGALSLLPFVVWKVDLAYLSNMSYIGWVSLSYTTVFATLIGFSLHNWSLGKLGPFKSSVYGYLLPITAAIAGFVLLGESVSWNQYVGGAGVLFAMFLVQRDRMQKAREKPISVPTALQTTASK